MDRRTNLILSSSRWEIRAVPVETELGSFLKGNLVGGSGHPGRLSISPNLEIGFRVDDRVLRGFDTGDKNEKIDKDDKGDCDRWAHRSSLLLV